MSYAKYFYVERALQNFNFTLHDSVSGLMLVFTAYLAKNHSVSLNQTVAEILAQIDEQNKCNSFISAYFTKINRFSTCTLETFEKVSTEDMVEYLIDKIEYHTLYKHKGSDSMYLPEQMNDLCAMLLDIKPSESLVDLGSGISSFLINAKKKFGADNVEGIEVDQNTYYYANILASLEKLNISVLNDDIFKIHSLKQYEKIFTFPPINAKLIAPYVQEYVNSKLGLTDENDNAKELGYEASFILKALDLLADNGKALIVIVPGVLFSPRFAKIRKYLIDNKYLEEVITLSEGVLHMTMIPVVLLILSRNNDCVKFVNAGNIHGKTRHGGSCLTDENVDEIYRMATRQNEKDKSKSELKGNTNVISVSTEKIQKNDYSLMPNTYLLEAKIPFYAADNFMPLGELVSKKITRGVQYGATLLDKLQTDKETGFYYVSARDIQGNRLNKTLKNLIYIEEKDNSLLLNNGDILLVMALTDSVKVAVVKNLTTQKLLPASNLYVIHPDEKLLLPEFLKILFESEYARQIFKEFSVGSSLRSISAEFLNKLLIPVPPLNEQQALIQRYNRIEEESEELKLKLEALSQKKKELIESNISM